MKYIISYLLACIITILIISFVCYQDIKSTTAEGFSRIEQIDNILLESQVILKDDTLDIINTNWLNASVILENNVTYSYKYIEPRLYPKENLDYINNILEK